MELVTEDAKEFKQCIGAIVNLIDEGVFEVSKEGMRLRSMDASQIAMVDFTLPKDAFSKVDAPEKASIGLNLVDLTKILSRARDNEHLSLSLDEKESRLLLTFSGGQAKRSFKMPLLDVDSSFPREPKITFEATIRIRGGEFKDMLKDAGMLSSHVTLHARKDEFVVEARGDSGELLIEMKKDSKAIEEITVATESLAMFPFEYLDDLTRACPDDSEIKLELKTDAPVRVSYNAGKAKLLYYLAPRVETA